MNVKITSPTLTIFLISSLLLCGCLTTKNMDQFVAEQYNNKLPDPEKKKNPAVTISSSIPFTPEKSISVTTKKTSNVLPLIVYWRTDYRHTCALNPAIALNSFASTITQQSAKINQKLNGQQLVLTVEQMPGAFSIVDEWGMILIFIHWDKLYVEPDFKDLVVSYKVLQNGAAVKTNRIIIKNAEQNKGIRFAQSWRSATSEYLSQYNSDITTMSRSFITKLAQEL